MQQKCMSHFNRVQQWGECGNGNFPLSSYLVAQVDKVLNKGPECITYETFCETRWASGGHHCCYSHSIDLKHIDTLTAKKGKKKIKKKSTPILSSDKEMGLVKSLLICPKISRSSSKTFKWYQSELWEFTWKTWKSYCSLSLCVIHFALYSLWLYIFIIIFYSWEFVYWF